MEQWKNWAHKLKVEAYTLYLAYKHPGVSWYARIFAACVVGYAFSPIDLIPDFIPILGYLDDLLLVPLGIFLAMKMIPEEILTECRAQSHTIIEQGKPINRTATVVIIAIWVLLVTMLIAMFIR